MENEIKPLPPYEVAMQKQASLRSITHKMHEEISTGPFRLFSDRAIEEVTRQVDRALDEAYDLGLADGEEATNTAPPNLKENKRRI